MSEYIDIEAHQTDDPNVIWLTTNLRLTEAEPEQYHTLVAMEEGSSLAQMLATIDGIGALRLDGQEAWITRDDTYEWHAIISDLSSALKEFFL